MGLFSWLFRRKKKNQEEIVDSNAVGTCDANTASEKDDVISADGPVTVSPDTEDIIPDEPVDIEPEIKNDDPVEPDAIEPDVKEDNPAEPDVAKPEVKEDTPAEPETKEDAPAVPDAVEPEVKDEAPAETDFSDKKDDIAYPVAEASDDEPLVETEDSVCDEPEKEKQGYTGRFEINKTRDGKKYFFNLYASNKVGIATSQMYSTAQNALNGVRSVIANAPKAAIEDQTLKTYETLPYPKWEIFIDNGGKYRFRLNATNGSCVCHSQGYTSKTNCKNGINSIIRSSRNPEIDKAYLIKKDQ